MFIMFPFSWEFHGISSSQVTKGVGQPPTRPCYATVFAMG